MSSYQEHNHDGLMFIIPPTTTSALTPPESDPNEEHTDLLWDCQGVEGPDDSTSRKSFFHEVLHEEKQRSSSLPGSSNVIDSARKKSFLQDVHEEHMGELFSLAPSRLTPNVIKLVAIPKLYSRADLRLV